MKNKNNAAPTQTLLYQLTASVKCLLNLFKTRMEHYTLNTVNIR